MYSFVRKKNYPKPQVVYEGVADDKRTARVSLGEWRHTYIRLFLHWETLKVSTRQDWQLFSNSNKNKNNSVTQWPQCLILKSQWMLYVLTFKNIDKIIPTSPQWKGLVLPVVQLYTMMFLGLQRQRGKQRNIREVKSILSLMYYQSRKTWCCWVPILYDIYKKHPKGLFLKCLGFNYKYYYYHKRMLRDYYYSCSSVPWLTYKKHLLFILF